MDSEYQVWMDGPTHPDLFDGETPIRILVPVEDTGMKVFRVECVYYIREEENVFIVAKDHDEAEAKAMEMVASEGCEHDSAEAIELEMHDVLGSRRSGWTAADLLAEHFEKSGCLLTQN